MVSVRSSSAYCESSIKMFTELESNAPINVKARGGGGGGVGQPTGL